MELVAGLRLRIYVMATACVCGLVVMMRELRRDGEDSEERAGTTRAPYFCLLPHLHDDRPLFPRVDVDGDLAEVDIDGERTEPSGSNSSVKNTAIQIGKTTTLRPASDTSTGSELGAGSLKLVQSFSSLANMGPDVDHRYLSPEMSVWR